MPTINQLVRKPRKTADIDNPARACPQHVTRRGPNHEKRPAQVGVDDVVELVIFHAHEQAVFGDAGVVHKDVQLGVLFDDLIDAPVAGGSIRNIERHGHDFGGVLAEFADPGLDCLGLAGGGDDGRAFLCKSRTNRLADAA